MKRFQVLIFVGLAIMITGCSGFSVIMGEGTYDLTADSRWGEIEGVSEENKFSAVLSDWKSDSDLKFSIPKPEAPMKYGTLIFGNTNQPFRFATTESNHCVDKIYMDQNGDGTIVPEEVKELRTSEVRGWSSDSSFKSESYYSFTNLPLYVRYLKANGVTISKKIDIRVSFQNSSFSRSGLSVGPFWISGGASSPATCMTYQVLTNFSGEVTVKNNQESKKVRFVLVDYNQNGIFNELGKDILLIDKNADGILNFTVEKRWLTESFQIPAQDSQPMQNLCLSLFAYPEKIIVTNVKSSPPEPALFEPTESDPWSNIK